MVYLSLAKDQFAVEPGSSYTLTVHVANRGESADRYELEISGLDHEWVAIPVPAFTLGAGSESSHKIIIKPPRTAESKAGTYPFVVQVRSMESGEKVEAQAVLEVEQFRLISAEVEPKRLAVSPFKKQTSFSVYTINMGNTEEKLQLFASDPEDACSYTFEHERVILAPGQEKRVLMYVQPNQFPLLSSTRLFSFAVSARSTEDPRTVANAQGQLERKAILSPIALVAALLAVILIAVWISVRPKPPAMESFAANVEQVYKGDPVELSWTSSNAKKVVIRYGDPELAEEVPPNDSKQFTLEQTTTFRAYAVRDGEESAPKEVTVIVTERPIVPPAEILEFSVNKRQAAVGESVLFKYKVKGAQKILLQPLGEQLEPNLEEIEVPLPNAGNFTYTLVAENAEGEATRSRPITITVREKSLAAVSVFRALVDGQPLPAEVDPGTRIQIEWVVSNAELVEITPNVGTVNARGNFEWIAAETTVFTLKATDAQGVSIEKQLKVTVKSPPPNVGGG